MELACIDVISGEIDIDYTEEWKEAIYRNTGREFGDRYGDYTGKIIFNLDTEFKNSRSSLIEYNKWKLTLVKNINKVTGEINTKLKIRGNPAEIYYGKNYHNAPLTVFKGILNEFAATFHLDLNKIRLTAPFEPSITVVDPIDLELKEESLFGRVILFQDKRCEVMYNKTDKFMGYKAKKAHYSEKVYLPSRKFNEPMNCLRIESKYNRIKTFTQRTGIVYWADLLSEDAMYRCYKVVLDGWDDVVIYDPKLKRSKKYPAYINEMIRKGKDPEYWLHEFPLIAACPKTRKNRMKEYRELCYQKGEGLHRKIRNWLVNEGAKFQNVTSRLTGNIMELDGKELNIEDCYKPNKGYMEKAKKVSSKQVLIKSEENKEVVIYPHSLIIRTVMRKASHTKIRSVGQEISIG
jgi:hypothetical protein